MAAPIHAYYDIRVTIDAPARHSPTAGLRDPAALAVRAIRSPCHNLRRLRARRNEEAKGERMGEKKRKDVEIEIYMYHSKMYACT